MIHVINWLFQLCTIIICPQNFPHLKNIGLLMKQKRKKNGIYDIYFVCQSLNPHKKPEELLSCIDYTEHINHGQWD